jgi:hypothetical protein
MACCVTCAAQPQSATELIRLLTHLSDLDAMGVIDNPCGHAMSERQSAAALAALWDAALPEIDETLKRSNQRPSAIR